MFCRLLSQAIQILNHGISKGSDLRIQAFACPDSMNFLFFNFMGAWGCLLSSV